jgi:thioredoxin reductase
MPDVRVVVVGAGPAGLATARELQKRGIRPRLLERGPALAHTWVNLYDSLTLHTGKHLSTLPGMRFERSTPLFPKRDHFVAYLRRYAVTFGIAVEPDSAVERATPPMNGGRWRLDTKHGTIEADAVVFATGIIANPVIPALPGRDLFRGRVTHAIEYRRPEPYRGRRVLVVGVGNSGGEIASELADAGAQVSISVRSGASMVPLTLLGIPIQYVAAVVWKLPKSIRQTVVSLVRRITVARRGPPVVPALDLMTLNRIPLIGFHLDEAVRSGRVRVLPCLTGFTADGAHFTDGSTHSFDDIILATGYRPALQPLEGLVRTDERGFALRIDRVTSADHPGLYFVGHNYDVTGGLRNIWKDAPLAAEAIRRVLFHAGA